MDFKEFPDKVKQDLPNILPGDLTNASIRFEEVSKLQQKPYTAMVVTPPKSNIGVSLNLNHFHEMVEDSGNYTSVLNRMMMTVFRGDQERPDVDIAQLTDYEQMKQHLIVQLVGKENNKDMLQNIPHTDLEDMAEVYRFRMDSNSMGQSTI